MRTTETVDVELEFGELLITATVELCIETSHDMHGFTYGPAEVNSTIEEVRIQNGEVDIWNDDGHVVRVPTMLLSRTLIDRIERKAEE